MKKIMLVVAVALMAISCKVDSKNKVETSVAKEVKVVKSAVEHKVSIESSTVNWKGFKPTGEHFGIVGISEGALNLTGGKLVGGTFTFDMNSIAVTDMPADNEYNAKLVGHLKSPDFFDVAKYPTAKFEITSVTEANGKLNVSGNLTIKEATKNITIPASLSNDEGTVTFTSEVFTVDRADFDVRYGSKSFFNDLKDKFINDDFEMSFIVNTVK